MGYLVAVLALVLWGLVVIPLKLVRAPGKLGVLISMPVAALVMCIISLATGTLSFPHASAADWLLIAFTGVCQFPLASFTYYEAVKLAGVTVTTPLTRLTPILVVLVSVILGFSVVTPMLVVATVVFLAGAALIALGIWRHHLEGIRFPVKAGLFYALIACVAWAAGNLLVSRVSPSIPRSIVTLYALLFGIAVHVSVMGVLGELPALRQMSRRDVLLFASHGTVSFAFGYWALFEAIQLLGVSRASVIAGTWPAVSVWVGVLLFREPMNVLKVLGTVLLIASAVLAGFA